MSSDNTGQIPTPPVPPPAPDTTAAIPVAPWAPDPTLAGAAPVPPTPYQQPGQQPWPQQGYPQGGYPPQMYGQFPQQPNPSAQFLKGEAFAGFRDVRKTAFGSEGFWPNLLRIIGWVYAGVMFIVVMITMGQNIDNDYTTFGTIIRQLLTGLVDVVLWPTICMVLANIAEDIDATRKNSDKTLEAAGAKAE
ncbi:MAG: hypothetical protein LBH11_00055 [Propionibacteriaceae bacterium]|jgi:hypothetical protein|nr:hypothetical protein [Propionibacteriaceae bacterium]